MADDKPKDKKAKKAKGDAAPLTNASIAAHPRAKAGIRRARTRAAVGAFVLVLVLNLTVANADPFDAVWRALVAGIVVNVIVWRCAIVVWRHVVISELRQAEDEYAARVQAARERLAEQARQQMQA
jgi:small-conductance mechanosensitive channel